MAWFRNFYECDRCGRSWIDEWSCTCDGDCPHCGARHMSASDSEDLTERVVCKEGLVVFLVSPPSAERQPNYRTVAAFPLATA